jgi:hypothetical protein
MIFLAFAALYLALGRKVDAPAAMLENVPFDADVFRVVGDLTQPEFGHYRTSVHPLFVILFLPPGAAMADLAGGTYEGARFLTALAAAAAVALLDRILRRTVRGPRELPWLLTLLYGLSASTLVFSTVPETYMFGVLSILPTYALLTAGVTRSAAWAGAILAAFAVTSTNVCQALAGYRFALSRAGGPRSWRPTLTLLAAALAALALSVVQIRSIPRASRSGTSWRSRPTRTRATRSPRAHGRGPHGPYFSTPSWGGKPASSKAASSSARASRSVRAVSSRRRYGWGCSASRSAAPPGAGAKARLSCRSWPSAWGSTRCCTSCTAIGRRSSTRRTGPSS